MKYLEDVLNSLAHLHLFDDCGYSAIMSVTTVLVLMDNSAF